MHVVGPNAGEMIQGFALAFKTGATKEHFDDLIGIHPTNAEVSGFFFFFSISKCGLKFYLNFLKFTEIIVVKKFSSLDLKILVSPDFRL